MESEYFSRDITIDSLTPKDKDNETIVKIMQKYESSCGGVVWDAALLMIKYFDYSHTKSSQKPLIPLKGQRVIELGSGTGATGIVAAVFGANVIVTDLSQQLPLMAMNVRENEVLINTNGGSIRAKEWRWGQFKGQQKYIFNWPLESIDLVIVCDCIYYNESIDDLSSTIIWLSSNGATILLSYEDRESKQYLIQQFFEILKSHDIDYEEIPQHDLHPEYRSDDLHLFKIQNKFNSELNK